VVPVELQPLFWFTTRDDVSIDSVLTEPVWKVAGEEGDRAILKRA
jgi:hypothetical protein